MADLMSCEFHLSFLFLFLTPQFKKNRIYFQDDTKRLGLVVDPTSQDTRTPVSVWGLGGALPGQDWGGWREQGSGWTCGPPPSPNGGVLGLRPGPCRVSRSHRPAVPPAWPLPQTSVPPSLPPVSTLPGFHLCILPPEAPTCRPPCPCL